MPIIPNYNNQINFDLNDLMSFLQQGGQRELPSREQPSREQPSREQPTRPAAPQDVLSYLFNAANVAAKKEQAYAARDSVRDESRRAREEARHAKEVAIFEARRAREEAREAREVARAAREAVIARNTLVAREAARAREAACTPRGPKILKKVETEDQYQIQIFKDHGDFTSYEVKAVKSQRSFSFQGYQPELLDITIQSNDDNFLKTFQFDLNDIDVSSIDWEWYKDENVLVLNIPKKRKVCDDTFASIFGIPQLYYKEPQARDVDYAAYKANEELKSKKIEAEQRKAEEKAIRVAHERARREALVRARKEEAARAEKERAQREKTQREKTQREKTQREKAEKERAQTEQSQKAEESANETKSNETLTAPPDIMQFLGSLLGPGFTSQLQNIHQYEGVPAQYSPSSSSSPKPTQSASKSTETHSESTDAQSHPTEPSQSSEPKSAPAPVESSSKDEEYHSDTDSINSDVVTPISSPESSPIPSTPEKLHRSISLEEVEDEEFVMFRKKFGQ